MKDFLKDHPASFTIVHDATKKLVGTANICSMPTSFAHRGGWQGRLVHKGFHGKDTAKQYEAEMEKLLAGKSPGSKHEKENSCSLPCWVWWRWERLRSCEAVAAQHAGRVYDARRS